MHDFSRHPLPSTPAVAVSPRRLAVVPIPSKRHETYRRGRRLIYSVGGRERERKVPGLLESCFFSNSLSPPPFFFFYARNKIVAVAKGLARNNSCDGFNRRNHEFRVLRGNRGKKRSLAVGWDRGEDLSSHCNAFYRRKDFIMLQDDSKFFFAYIRVLHWTLRDDLGGEESFLYIAWISNDRWIIVGRRLVSRCLFADVGVVCRLWPSVDLLCEMLRDIMRATNAVMFSFLFCFVRSRVSFAKSVDDNVERTLVLLFIFVIFFFSILLRT